MVKLVGGFGNDDYDENFFILVKGVGRIMILLIFCKYV